MATSIEIWRSISGLADGDFTLLTTVADGASYSYLDSPTIPQQIYIYKARRFDPDLNAYSEFSPAIFVRGPWPRGIEMAINTNLGVQSKLGASVESTEGHPVQVTRLIDRVSGNLEIEMAVLPRRSLRYITAPFSAVPGLAAVRGSVVVEPTPEGVSELICSFLGAPVTTTPVAAPTAPVLATATVGGTLLRTHTYIVVITYIKATGETLACAETSLATGGTTDTNTLTVPSPTAGAGITGWNVYVGTVSGQLHRQNSVPGVIATDFTLTAPPIVSGVAPPTSSTYNIHTWSDGFSQLPITLAERRGSSIFCFTGVKTGSLNVRLDKTQNDPFQMTFDMMALNQYMQYLESDLALDTAGFDPLPAFAAVSAAVSIGGTVSADARTLDLRLPKNMGDRNALDGTRGANSHYIQGSEPTGTMTLYFSDETELRRYFGQATTVTGPYGGTKKIVYVPITVNILGGPNPSGVVNQMVYSFPNCTYEAVGLPVQGKEAIMQEVRFRAFHDTTTNTSFQIIIWNNQSNSSIVTPGTALTFVPANDITSYATP